MVSILIDGDLHLRSHHAGDAPELLRAVNASRPHLRPWLTWVDGTTKVEHSLQFIQQSLQRQHNQEALELGIFMGTEIIGGIGMHQWDHNLKRGQIGYWIAREHEGKGILTQCLERLMDFLFDKLQLNKIEIHYVPHNKRSAVVAQRLGCQVEGVLRQSYLIHGQLYDIVVTGLLRGEWKSRGQQPPLRKKL